MARLTNTNTNGKGNASQRKGNVSASKSQETQNGNKEFSFTFEAPAGHVSTGKTLVVYKGRGNGGVDVYLPLERIAKELGYLPEDAEITVSVKAKGKAISDPFVAVPKTSQHLFDKSEEHTWEEVYGGTFAEHLRALKSAKPAEERKAAQGKRASKAEAPKAEKTLADARMDRLEEMMGKLAQAVLSGKGK